MGNAPMPKDLQSFCSALNYGENASKGLCSPTYKSTACYPDY